MALTARKRRPLYVMHIVTSQSMHCKNQQQLSVVLFVASSAFAQGKPKQLAGKAYTLANIDSNRALIESMPERRPMRPYYWTLLHGGGGGWRWWKGQPLANEEWRNHIADCWGIPQERLTQTSTQPNPGMVVGLMERALKDDLLAMFWMYTTHIHMPDVNTLVRPALTKILSNLFDSASQASLRIIAV